MFMQIEIQLNGESLCLVEGCSLGQLVEQQALSGKRIAIEVNGDLVPRSEHQSHRLEAGDRVEIVQAIGGG
jgi:sulfur carrier protein